MSSQLSLLVTRLSSALSNASSSFNVSLPWDGLSSFLIGGGSSTSRRRRRRAARSARSGRSRSSGAGVAAPATIIPPPHSHAFRRQEYQRSLDAGAPAGYDHPFRRALFGYSNLSSASPGSLQSPSSLSSAEKEKNILAAVVSILVIATLATALAQPKWFSIKGGTCNKKYIGLQEFFYMGRFSYIKTGPVSALEREDHPIDNKTQTGHGKAGITSTNANIGKGGGREHNFEENKTRVQEEPRLPDQPLSSFPTHHQIIYYGVNGDLKNCVTPEIVSLQRTIIALCFFAIILNLLQFFLDTLGTSRKWVNIVRLHAVGNILGVVFCIMIIGVAYLVSSLLEKEQQKSLSEFKPATGEGESSALKHVEVRFELSYYLVTLAGLLGLLAGACNLLKKPNQFYLNPGDFVWPQDGDHEANTPLDDDLSSSFRIHSSSPSNLATLIPVPPPPPYSP